jgi:hypothetical protein
MKPFTEWMKQQTSSQPENEELPEGLYIKDGSVFATCLRCEEKYEIFCDISEFIEDMSYCGRSQYCLP